MPPSRQQKNQRREKKGNRKLKDQLEGLLRGLGLGGDFHHLIDKAIREGFSPGEFETAVMHSKSFKRKFPGLVQRNQIASFFSDAQGATTLSTAVKAYNQLVNSYEQTMRNFQGSGLGRLNRDNIGALIKGQVSPEEFATRIGVVNTVNANPGLEDEFNRVLKEQGMAPLNKQDFFRFIGKTAPAKLYDVYEAAQLRAAGLDISPEEAYKAAGAVGNVGQLGDVRSIIQQIRAIKPDVAPELARAGISDADLVALEAGVDQKGIEGTLRTLVANRRSLGQPVFGQQLRRGAGGGLAQGDDEGAFAPD